MIWLRREGDLVRNGLNICPSAKAITLRIGRWFGYVRWRSRERGGSYWSVHRITEVVEW